MIAASFKALTWATLATAVISALMLALVDGGQVRTERIDSALPASTVNAGAGPATGNARDASPNHPSQPH